MAGRRERVLRARRADVGLLHPVAQELLGQLADHLVPGQRVEVVAVVEQAVEGLAVQRAVLTVQGTNLPLRQLAVSLQHGSGVCCVLFLDRNVGKLLVLEQIKRADSEHCREIDFLVGDTGWKEFWNLDKEPVFTLDKEEISDSSLHLLADL